MGDKKDGIYQERLKRHMSIGTYGKEGLMKDFEPMKANIDYKPMTEEEFLRLIKNSEGLSLNELQFVKFNDPTPRKK